MPTHVGEHIRSLRRSKRWTQEALATAIGTGRTEISKAENNASPPTQRMLARLALALGDAETVIEAFELAGYGRQRAVLTLDELQHERGAPARDPLRVLEDALLAGGWAGHVRKALLVLAAATRPVIKPSPQ